MTRIVDIFVHYSSHDPNNEHRSMNQLSHLLTIHTLLVYSFQTAKSSLNGLVVKKKQFEFIIKPNFCMLLCCIKNAKSCNIGKSSRNFGFFYVAAYSHVFLQHYSIFEYWNQKIRTLWPEVKLYFGVKVCGLELGLGPSTESSAPKLKIVPNCKITTYEPNPIFMVIWIAYSPYWGGTTGGNISKI